MRPLGFEDRHLEVLQDVLNWARSDEDFASFETKYKPVTLEPLASAQREADTADAAGKGGAAKADE